MRLARPKAVTPQLGRSVTWLTPVRRRAILHGLLIAGWAYFLIYPVFSPELGHDSFAYWSLDLEQPYVGSWRDLGFFPYSPPIALLFSPLTLLPYSAFLVLWACIALAALGWMARDVWTFAVLLAFPFVTQELVTGNIHLLLAAAIVAGFRWPAAWSFVLLTKVTPGVGLLWFVLRGEWRSLAIALGATAVVVGVTFAVVPGMWFDWVALLLAEGSSSSGLVPLPLRMLLAVVIIVWGARTDRAWTVPVVALIALPAPWPASYAMLAALPVLVRAGRAARSLRVETSPRR